MRRPILSNSRVSWVASSVSIAWLAAETQRRGKATASGAFAARRHLLDARLRCTNHASFLVDPG
jgi:hypothetical protein